MTDRSNAQGAETQTPWQARWIWYPGARNTVNFHFFARKAVQLQSATPKAELRISVFTDYKLFINGRFAGRGPVPSDPSRPSYDTYDVSAFLTPGENVIGVLCHNYGIGTHWQHKGPGGLICQLDMTTEQGPVSACTDETWMVHRADCYRPNSPRICWSAGFMETFDAHRLEEGWSRPGFDDSHWNSPEVLGAHQTTSRRTLESRDIPQLRERFVRSQSIERGRFELAGVHVVSFGSILPPGQAGVVYAQTFVQMEHDAELLLHIACDDAFKALVNGALVVEQNYNQEFARTRVWRGLDEYEQVHYGVTGNMSPLRVPVHLKKGPNRVTVAVDQGPGGWGFVLAFLKPGTQEVLNLTVSGDAQARGGWAIAGPFDSTGMNDSLDHVVASLDDLPGPAAATIDPFRYDEVTDYATVMTSEMRSAFRAADRPDEVVLREGEYCVVDLGKVRVGFPVLHVEASQDAILDVGYGHVLFEDRRIRFSNRGWLKYVDRLYAKAGRQEWQPMQRRTGRYIHVSCRKGRSVRLSGLGIATIGYPVERIAQFESSDPTLNRIWAVSRYTTELLMQYGYQDCLKREEGTLNTSSFNYASRSAACCFGDTLLARRCLRTAILTQHDNGWFDSHGISSPNNDEPTMCLWWVVWLKDYLLYSGDRDFVAELFDGVENILRYFSKAISRHGLIDERNYHIQRQGQWVYLQDELNPLYEPVRFQGELLGTNILFYGALRAAEAMAAAIGLNQRADYYDRRADRVRRSCNEHFWHEQKGLYAEWLLGDEAYHAIIQITALYFDLCDEPQRSRVLDHLTRTVGLPGRDRPDYPLRMFGYYHYFLDILFRSGHEATAIELMKTYYGSWLDAGGTTFGESYHMACDHRNGRLDSEYDVHAYGTSAHLHFYSNILGVTPLEPGFRKVLLAPKPANLTSAKGVIATPVGPITVEWQNEAGQFRMDVALPDQCHYEFRRPATCAICEIAVNGKKLECGGYSGHRLNATGELT